MTKIVVNNVTRRVEVHSTGWRGIQGEKGDAATVSVGAVTTVAPNQPASVTNAGDEHAAILEFAIPQGAKGEQGERGPEGPQGLKGEKGDTGDIGPKGDKGDTGDVTPAAIAAKDAAESARDDAEASRIAAAGSAGSAAAEANRAELARDAAEDSVQYDYLVADNTALNAITGMTSGQRAFVRATEHVWHYDGSAWVDDGPAPTAQKVDKDAVFTVPGKNLIDKATMIVRRSRYRPTQGDIVVDASWRRTTHIPVVEGQAYTLSGRGPGGGIGFFETLISTNSVANAGGGNVSFIVPTGLGINYVVINVTSTGQDDTTFDDTIQLEKGSTATEYEPFKKVIAQEDVKDLPEVLASKLEENVILEQVSFNKINLDEVDFVQRYSTASQSKVNDTLGIAASGRIPVKEGEFYTISGDGIYGSGQGGYFTGPGATTAVQNIVFTSPVTGPGYMFQVPTGLGITEVIINLRKAGGSSSATTLDGDAQLELGEMATAFQPYEPHPKVREELLPDGSGGGGGGSGYFDAALWYKFTNADAGDYLAGRLPNFRRDWVKKTKDLCVVNTGTSLTARSTEHCTEHPLASYRPPLMHSMNFVTHIWDRLAWEGQQYRRYDAVGVFTETGSFLTASNLEEWDDGTRRAGLTRYSGDAGAAVAFSVPEGAWQVNFIYRTDSVGVETNTLSVAEGYGKMEVFDATSETWVEANGYQFSMREPTPVNRNIAVPDANTGTTTVMSIPSKGNTTYQKRLKMRCKSGAIDSRSEAKTVTITAASSGRFMYWGLEWSSREFMITYINAARGSHHTRAENATGLPRYQDNEIWSFKPDLMLFELPTHNDGAANVSTPHPPERWWRLVDNFVFNETYELSMVSRSAYFGLAPEIAMFSGSIAWNFEGINDDGSLKIAEQTDGSMQTALDRYDLSWLWVLENHPEAVFINTAKRWVDAGIAIFGNLRTATEGSGKGGQTFTNEGSHWNDTGCKIMAKAVIPLVNFVY